MPAYPVLDVQLDRNTAWLAGRAAAETGEAPAPREPADPAPPE